MLRLVNQITLGGQTFDYTTDIEIESTWDMLTDTATMKMPRKFRFIKDGEVVENVISGDNPLFKRGDAVTFVIGYGEETAQRFEGYLTEISPRNPLEFGFQDAMYLLKQYTPKLEDGKPYSKTGLTLKSLLNDIIVGVPVVITQDFTIGKYNIPNGVTAAQALNHLKKNYGVTSYFRDGTLYSGVAYKLRNIDELKIVSIDMEQFVIDDSGLSYQRNDDQNIKVKAISIYPNNTREEVVVGDENGGERTQYFYDVPVADLEKYANEQLEKYKFTGFTGSFVTFVNPIVRHGDAVKLISTKRPDAQGIYLVKKVTTTSGIDGGRQIIELDIKVE
jgi:hypothetical protein